MAQCMWEKCIFRPFQRSRHTWQPCADKTAFLAWISLTPHRVCMCKAHVHNRWPRLIESGLTAAHRQTVPALIFSEILSGRVCYVAFEFNRVPLLRARVSAREGFQHKVIPPSQRTIRKIETLIARDGHGEGKKSKSKRKGEKAVADVAGGRRDVKMQSTPFPRATKTCMHEHERQDGGHARCKHPRMQNLLRRKETFERITKRKNQTPAGSLVVQTLDTSLNLRPHE